jgi:hypothetical protein
VVEAVAAAIDASGFRGWPSLSKVALATGLSPAEVLERHMRRLNPKSVPKPQPNLSTSVYRVGLSIVLGGRRHTA